VGCACSSMACAGPRRAPGITPLRGRSSGRMCLDDVTLMSSVSWCPRGNLRETLTKGVRTMGETIDDGQVAGAGGECNGGEGFRDGVGLRVRTV